MGDIGDGATYTCKFFKCRINITTLSVKKHNFLLDKPKCKLFGWAFVWGISMNSPLRVYMYLIVEGSELKILTQLRH